VVIIRDACAAASCSVIIRGIRAAASLKRLRSGYDCLRWLGHHPRQFSRGLIEIIIRGISAAASLNSEMKQSRRRSPLAHDSLSPYAAGLNSADHEGNGENRSVELQHGTAQKV
jgi:hypothetical protein